MGVPITTVDPSLPTVLAPPSSASTSYDGAASFVDELERQVTAYVELGIPSLLGLDEQTFRGTLAPPADPPPIESRGAAVDGDAVPFLLVVPGLDVNDLAPAMRRGSKIGVSVIDRDEAPTYTTIEGVEVQT